MKTYKGFYMDMTCRGYKYEIGRKEVHDGEVKPCESGFHSCENPIDVLKHYKPNDSRYAICSADGEIVEGCLKMASSEITPMEEITTMGLVAEAIKYANDNKTGAYIDDNGGSFASVIAENSSSIAEAKASESVAVTEECASIAVANGYQSAAVAVERNSIAVCKEADSVAVALDRRSLAVTEGYGSVALALSENSAAEAHSLNSVAFAFGSYGRARGVVGSIIAFLDWGNEISLVSARVDNENFFEGVWYRLGRDRKIVRAYEYEGV